MSFNVVDTNIINVYPTVISEEVKGTSSGDALRMLIEGNQSFVNGDKFLVNSGREEINQLSAGQNPFCSILNCADSREPVATIFSRGLGDIFNVKTAGVNVSGVGTYGANNGATADNSVIASIEFSISALNVPLLVVMGHSECGAVAASYTYYGGLPGAIPGTPPADPTYADNQIPYLVTGIKPAAVKALGETASANRASQYQVDTVLSYLRDNSTIIDNFMQNNDMLTYGAYYNLDTGKVDFALYDRTTGLCNWPTLY